MIFLAPNIIGQAIPPTTIPVGPPITTLPSSTTTTSTTTTTYLPPNYLEYGSVIEGDNVNYYYSRNEFRNRFFLNNKGETEEQFRKEWNDYKNYMDNLGISDDVRYKLNSKGEPVLVDQFGITRTVEDYKDKKKQAQTKVDEKIANNKDKWMEYCGEECKSLTGEELKAKLRTKYDERKQKKEAVLREIVGLLFPSTGAKQIGSWIQEKLFGTADFTEDWKNDPKKDWYFNVFNPADAATSAFCNGKNKKSVYFEQTGPNMYAGGEWPSLSMNSMLYIYGTKKEYADQNGIALHDWPSGDKWFPAPDGTALGYLYTFSWNFNHPYTQDQIDNLEENERKEKGLGEETGNIYYRIITVLSDNDKKRGKVWNVSPATTSHQSTSFYSKDDIVGIYILFINGYKHNGYERFPVDGSCDAGNNIGCVKIIPATVVGTAVNPSNTPGGTTGVTGGPVPLGGGPGVPGGDEECGDYGCLF